MKINSDILLDNILDQIRQNIDEVEKLNQYELQKLTWRESQNSWNILECLSHLNLYSEQYLPSIANKIQNYKGIKDEIFISGFWGNLFAESMLPKKNQLKFKAFKNMNPTGSIVNQSAIDQFVQYQRKFMELVQFSKFVNLNEIKIETSFSQFIRLKLGDMYLFLSNHTKRHLLQIKKIELAFESTKV
ncbi:MAG: DinB family protein [Bacteroidota bacterium]|nr:DinB family protein [Bacteroidota bacterium]